jgi:acetylornithine/succinyldiaminopimelate/putrescine aminotransferase
MIEKFKTNAEVIENGDKYLYGNHVRMPISMERGEGVYVFDKDGNKYLDFVGGIAVSSTNAFMPELCGVSPLPKSFQASIDLQI